MYKQLERGAIMKEERIVALYASRRYSIRELAKLSGLSYSKVRTILHSAGYSHGLMKG